MKHRVLLVIPPRNGFCHCDIRFSSGPHCRQTDPRYSLYA